MTFIGGVFNGDRINSWKASPLYFCFDGFPRVIFLSPIEPPRNNIENYCKYNKICIK